MGVASLVIGIIAAILGFIPVCGYFALIPAVIALVLGIIDVILKTKKQKPRGCGIAGIVLNAVALLIIILWTAVFSAAAVAAKENGAFDKGPLGKAHSTTVKTISNE